VLRFAPLVRRGGSVLDVACGSGRHLRHLAGLGLRATGVDRDADAVAPLREIAEIVAADIENGPWPFAGRRFDAVVVTNYLWRPLLPTLRESLVADEGVLIYETFADGQQQVGRPSRPEFLLQPGELLRAFAGLHLLAYEDGWLGGAGEEPRRVQRLAAIACAPGGLKSRPSIRNPPA
jgi:SAM-dependent methyltransferase